MTKYENREIPEGINVSQAHPLKEFASLVLAAVLIVVAAVVILSFMAEYLVRFVPFETEKAIAASLEEKIDTEELDGEQREIQDYLQSLATTLASHQGLPDEMTITVHYVDDEVVNAFATLGGHIVMYRGLLQQLPHENALSMVMAHEIAHIKHRDPIVALGRGITVLIAMASIAGVSDSSFFERILGQTSNLTILGFSRKQEQEADVEALSTLQSHYGHLQGAAALFEILEQHAGSFNTPAFFNTHPLTEDRIAAAKTYARSQTPTATVELRELPEMIRRLKNVADSS